MRFALVVVEEHAGATVELRHDDAFGAVDDEGAGVRHQRDLAEVDFLLLDVAHDAVAAVARVVDHQLRVTLMGAANVIPRCDTRRRRTSASPG